MAYRKIPPKQWPARNEVRALARQHTVAAMEILIHLMRTSESDFVVETAARTVLMHGHPEEEQKQKPRYRRQGPRGRKGPRDAGDGDGAGMPALPGQREGVRDEP